MDATGRQMLRRRRRRQARWSGDGGGAPTGEEAACRPAEQTYSADGGGRMFSRGRNCAPVVLRNSSWMRKNIFIWTPPYYEENAASTVDSSL